MCVRPVCQIRGQTMNVTNKYHLPSATLRPFKHLLNMVRGPGQSCTQLDRDHLAYSTSIS